MKTFTLGTTAETERYDYLSRLSMDRWAWEFARRNTELLEDARTLAQDGVSEMKAPCENTRIRLLRPRTTQTLAERWGLVFMPDPKLNGFEADVVWSHYVFPHQVEVNCTPRRPGETCTIWDSTVPHCEITHVTDRSAREYLLLRGNSCVVQVRCTGQSLLGLEPVRMKLQISDMDAYEKKLEKQKEALKLYGEGPDISDPLWTKTTQILRNGLIALDGLKAGLTQREIAIIIYGENLVASEWGEDGGSLRAHLRYVIAKAETLRDGGYLVELLGAHLGGDLRAA